MQELLALREDKPAASLPGDTVDVWYDRKLYWLTDVPLANKVTLRFPPIVISKQGCFPVVC